MKFSKRQVLGLATAAAMAWFAPAHAQTAEEFYKGKQLTFLVSAPAGSLTDFVARAYATYFTKHMVGNPEVIVLNLAGAGGMMAAAQLQLKEVNDGTVVGFLQRNNLYVPLVEGPQSGFDPREVSWLGSLEKVAYAIVAMDNSSVLTTEEMFSKPMFLGATGFANENRTLPALVNELGGSQFNIIHGYDARGEVYLAMERGEVEGWASTIAGLAIPDTKQMLDSGKLKILLHLAFESHPAYPDVPNLSTYITDPAGKELYSWFLTSMEAGRPVAVPKGVPEDRLAALRTAFDAAAADPDFIKSMQEKDYPVEPITGAAVEEVIAKLYATPDATMEKVRAIMTAKAPAN